MFCEVTQINEIHFWFNNDTVFMILYVKSTFDFLFVYFSNLKWNQMRIGSKKLKILSR